jgi:hypothetical protein
MARSKGGQQVGGEEGRVTETATVTKHSLRAFLAAPSCTDTRVLREELERRGVYAYELDDVAKGGVPLTELLDEAVRGADLVVVVLGEGKKENVLVELGFALALRKRVLAIVPPGEDLPVEPVPYLRTSPDNREAIGFGLTQLLAAPGPWRPGKNDAVPGTKPLGPIADGLLQKFRAAAAHPDELEMAEIVHEALQASGIAVMNRSLTRTSAEDDRADFAIWSDDFEPWVGNPLLIQVRTRIGGPGDLGRVLTQMTAMLEKTSTMWGLLLYWGEGEPTAEAARHPRVFVLTIGRFLELLRETSLGDLLRGMRNRRVHGRG